MRIIHRSEFEFECPKCKALLGVTGRDIIFDDVGHSPFTYSINCPCCRQRVGVEYGIIPHAVRNDIDDMD